jgi:hypothetical protein
VKIADNGESSVTIAMANVGELVPYQCIPRTLRGRLRIPLRYSVLVKAVEVPLSPVTIRAGRYGAVTAYTTPTVTIVVPDCTTTNSIQLLSIREHSNDPGRPHVFGIA